MTKITITTPILLIIIIKDLLNLHFIHVRLLFLAVTSYTIVSNSILIILMLISFWKSPPCLKNFVKLQNHELISRNVQKDDYPMLQFHEIFNVKKCNNINAKFVLLILVSSQRIKSKFFEQFYDVQKMLVLAFEALISDSISTNNSINCTFFEYSAAWC